jgi:hypothetical protein
LTPVDLVASGWFIDIATSDMNIPEDDFRRTTTVVWPLSNALRVTNQADAIISVTDPYVYDIISRDWIPAEDTCSSRESFVRRNRNDDTVSFSICGLPGQQFQMYRGRLPSTSSATTATTGSRATTGTTGKSSASIVSPSIFFTMLVAIGSLLFLLL